MVRGKGSLKRKQKSVFTKGHKLSYVRRKSETPREPVVRDYIRPTAETYDLALSSPVGPPVTLTNPDAPVILRPRRQAVRPQPLQAGEYRLLAPERVLQLFQTAFREHSTQRCDGEFMWDQAAECKWGVCWRMGLKCKKCTFKTGPQKLYYEVNAQGRGRKAATANVGLQVGLSQNMVSNTAMRQILLSSNVTPPTPSAMQKQANKVGAAIESLNMSDMQRQREKLQAVQHLRGQAGKPIPVEGDARYNNNLTSGGGKTLYQPATQTVYTLAENVTKKKKVIGVYTGNKLCHTANLLRSQGGEPACPTHPGVCTANLREEDIIGDEQRAVQEILNDISGEVSIGAITTDGDSRAQQACPDSVQSLRDTRHFGNSLRKKIESAPFSDRVFPGKTKSEKNTWQKRFSQDLAKRCNAEFDICFKEKKGDTEAVVCALSYTIDCIEHCYGGDCSLCEKYSFTCRGGEKYLMPPSIELDFSDDRDRHILRELLNFRLGRKAVLLCKFNSNTQKVESVNRTYQKTNPKLVTWTRNFRGRIHSGVHLRNNGIKNSTLAKMKHLGIEPTTSVVKELERMEKKQKLRLDCKKTVAYRRRLKVRIISRYRKYDRSKAAKLCSHYKKGITMPSLSFGEHSYCKRKYRN